MDKTKTGNSSNANAPGTFPDDTKPIQVTPGLIQTVPVPTGDLKAPNNADPLNAGVPTASAKGSPDEVIELEIGGAGTIMIAGFLSQNDYNPELRGIERIKTYDKMRKGDATVKLALSAIKFPIFSTTWTIKPPEDEDDNGERTTFIREELFKNPNFFWTSFMSQAFLFCDYGNMFAEKVWRRRMDNKIGWKGFKPRLPQTILRYTLQDGKTPGITQILPTGGNAEIPQQKLLTYILELEGSNYEGVSVLRAMHKHWVYKDLLYKIDAISSERQGMGFPVIKVPPAANPDDKKRARIVAANMRVNPYAYMDLPLGFTIEYIDTKAGGLKNVDASILHQDRQILKAVQAHFLDMGGSHAGSMALSDNQKEAFFMQENYYAKVFQEPTQMAISELCDMNWTGLKSNQYPTLEYGNVGGIDLVKLSTALMNASEAGILSPDDDIERHFRAAAELPEFGMGASSDTHIDWSDRKMKQQPPPIAMPAKAGTKMQPKRIVNRESMDKIALTEQDFYEIQMELEEQIQQRLYDR